MNTGRSWVALVAGVLLAAPGCGNRAAAGRANAAPAPVRVQLVATTALELPDTIAVTGVLAAREELALGFQVAGRLTRLDVDVGDVVAAGALLGQLDVVDFSHGVQRAEAALASARARLGLPAAGDPDAVEVDAVAAVREAQAVVVEAELARQRVEELVRQNLRPQAERDAVDAALLIAQSRLQAARDTVRTRIAECRERQIDLDIAHKRALDARLVAPYAGRVAARHAAAGRFVAVGEPVLTLLCTDPLRLRLQVPDRQAGAVQQDQRVEFTVDGEPADKAYEGRVVRLGAAIGQVDRTLMVEAAVANADGALRPGAFCRARIVVRERRAVLTVPHAAVQSFAGVDRVFVVADGKAEGVLVELGRRVGDRVEILAGLTAAQQVVASPRGLAPGAAVMVEN